MGTLFLFGLTLIAAAVLFVVGVRVNANNRAAEKAGEDTSDNVPGWIFKVVGAVVLFVGALVLFLKMFTVVGGTQVAVPVSFGRPGEPLNRGPHLVAPWVNVETFGTTFQVKDLDFNVEGRDGGTMAASVKVRYRILLERETAEGDETCSVKDLFQFARSEDRLEELFVVGDTTLETRNAFRQYLAFEGYTDKQTEIAQAASDAINLKWADKCLELDTLTVTGLVPSPQVQTAIDTALAARQNVDKAEQDRLAAVQAADAAAYTKTADADAQAYAKTAAAQAELDAAQDLADANDVLDASLTPEVLQRLLILALRDTKNQVIYLPNGMAGNLVLTQDAQAPTSTVPES